VLLVESKSMNIIVAITLIPCSSVRDRGITYSPINLLSHSYSNKILTFSKERSDGSPSRLSLADFSEVDSSCSESWLRCSLSNCSRAASNRCRSWSISTDLQNVNKNALRYSKRRPFTLYFEYPFLSLKGSSQTTLQCSTTLLMVQKQRIPRFHPIFPQRFQ